MRPPISTFTNKTTYLQFPPLPQPFDGQELSDYFPALQTWYEDLTKVLQRDREEILAKINQLS